MGRCSRHVRRWATVAVLTLVVTACAAEDRTGTTDPEVSVTADDAAPAPVTAPEPAPAPTEPTGTPAPETAPEPAPEPGPEELIRIAPGPGADPNSNYFWGLPYFPEVAQSLRVPAPMLLTGVELHPMLVAYQLPGYWDQPEEVRITGSLLETTPGGEVRMDVGVTVLRGPGDAPLLAPLRPSTLEVVGSTVARGPFRFAAPGSPMLLGLTDGIALTPGPHLLVLEFLPTDPGLFELRLQGMHYGGETSRVGFSRTDGTIDCDFTPPADPTPDGMAMFRERAPIDGSGAPPQPGAPLDRFIEHRGKVSECTVIGRFSDIFNPGDLRIDLWGEPLGDEPAGDEPPGTEPPGTEGGTTDG